MSVAIQATWTLGAALRLEKLELANPLSSLFKGQLDSDPNVEYAVFRDVASRPSADELKAAK
jgi:hypothetical protein